MLTRKNLFWLPFLVLLVQSCSQDRLDVDASHIKVNIKFEDMRTTIHDSQGDKLLKAHHRYLKQMPDIYNYFLGACLQFPEGYTDSVYLGGIEAFQQDKDMKMFESEIDKEFKDLKNVKSKIKKGFQHLKYHLPNAKMPKYVVFMNTLFRSSVWCTESEIGVGLGNYLGPKSKTVSKLNPNVYYKWIKEAMNRNFLERDVAENWIRTHYLDEVNGNLAEHIIREGKILYLTKAAFPKMSDHLILRYSKSQWSWAQKNEYAFWKYLVDENALFDKEEITIMNLTRPGPKTPGLPIKGSPDRMGQYLGYQIVRNYMEDAETSVKGLIKLSYTDILQSYEPEE